MTVYRIGDFGSINPNVALWSAQLQDAEYEYTKVLSADVCNARMRNVVALAVQELTSTIIP